MLDQTMIDIAIKVVYGSALIVIASMSLYRMSLLDDTYNPLIGLSYLSIMVGSLCGAFSPYFWPQHPGVGSMIFSLTVAAYVMIEGMFWHGGNAPQVYKEGRECNVPAMSQMMGWLRSVSPSYNSMNRNHHAAK